MSEQFEVFCRNNKIPYLKNEPMKLHTSFKIGGPSELFVIPEDEKQLTKAVIGAKKTETPYFILGNGSNILVSDSGINGAVISLSKLNKIEVEGETVTAMAGSSLSAVCRAALDNGLTGLEFAYGIPGSIGGALFMNAGAYGGEMKDVVCSATVLKGGETVEISAEDMELSYRNSIFKSGEYVILSVCLKLEKGDKNEINAKMLELIGKRKAKQPIEYPSAGSTFKRPTGNFAGTLIEKNGLKGLTCGGAMVSEKHAGFVINFNNATCKDVLNVIEKVKTKVYTNDNVMLEPEVIFVGKDL